jgi:hypothetical protein
VCAPILDPILVPHRTVASAGSAASTAAAGADTLLARSAEERSRDAFLRVLLLVDALPNKISLMMEDWYRVSLQTVLIDLLFFYVVDAHPVARCAAQQGQPHDGGVVQGEQSVAVCWALCCFLCPKTTSFCFHTGNVTCVIVSM